MKRLTLPTLLFILLFNTSLAIPQETHNAPVADEIQRVFLQPDSVPLGTFWYWVSNNISPEGAVEDLKAMKRAGVNLAFISNIGPSTWWNHNHPLGNVKFMSEEWWNILHVAMKTATEEGIDLGLFNCAGWSQSGGPWIKPEQSMKILVATEMHVNGNRKQENLVIPKPAEVSETQMKEMLKSVAGEAQYTDEYIDYFVDVRTVAFPVETTDAADTLFVAPTFEGLSKQGTVVLNSSVFKNRQLPLLKASQMVDLTDRMSPDGTLDWVVPEGSWVILRIGATTNGVTNSPAVAEATGLEVDKMNRRYVAQHFDSYIGEVLRRIPVQDRKCLKYAVLDSYEKGGQDYTDGIIEKFSARFGYDMTCCLPIYFGYMVESEEFSETFLSQLRRYISDEICSEYVDGFRQQANAHGLKTWLENYGHGGFSSEAIAYGKWSDEVAGEFWTTSHTDEKRVAASCAHLYGKPLVWAESFTSDPRYHGAAFSRYPGSMKKHADLAFTQGINSTIFHVFIQQLANDEYPGVDAWFGTELNRKNTYWSHIDLFVDYMKRVGWMLRQGKSVNDVAYYYGEETPIMYPERLPKLPAGFDFDDMNTDGVMNYLKVENGRIVTPSGASYKVLVLPSDQILSDSVKVTVEALRKRGATIVKGGSTAELAAMLGTPDCYLGQDESLRYCHRHLTDGREVYFIANLSDTTRSVTAEFRVCGKTPELWHPVTGEIRTLPAWSETAERTTRIPLVLQPSESVFVVFANRKSTATADSNEVSWKTLDSKTSSWSVTFSSDSIHRGPAVPVVLPQLVDLSQSQDSLIRYYSSTTVYNADLSLRRLPQGKVYLNLGEVAQMAKVWVNDSYVGGVWTAPYRLDVTDAVKKGVNKIRVEVVGTWWNRLVGDSRLPEDEQKLKAYTISWDSSSELMPYGLLGPVLVEGQE